MSRCRACNCKLNKKDLAADPLQELCITHLIGVGIKLFDDIQPQEDENNE